MQFLLVQSICVWVIHELWEDIKASREVLWCIVYNALLFFLGLQRAIYCLMPAQQTQNICITFIQRWTNVEDVGSTLYKFSTNILCLLALLSRANLLEQSLILDPYATQPDNNQMLFYSLRRRPNSKTTQAQRFLLACWIQFFCQKIYIVTYAKWIYTSYTCCSMQYPGSTGKCRAK